ncbi:hypothetical protein [Burkholderia cenocepacia]|uniref:Phage DNA-binding protein n=1 Tax=Burkholderia cenocepacia (strain ATCC BAA-245 / DSM 16553 / LMG 16656 / NCTC 13227 / J2315 / CF5610) TaxID=216591 RepID=B4EFR7_BURCJ|nr:hypothetical protein [Burkholderia cenocepacia]KIS52204.1 hypothetical protein NP88_2254 [Burkholderia cepacia]EPZ88206.1 hypothetical protein BURCENK562V_C3088 [Burkholderia cenocepacia K56-2Valvano]ERI31429.1 hypothetical protein BURCENBC7_AP3238 [Burkholderia cenocepacia BC7]KKI81601.1 hypothetical protein WQ49_16205 [Burkholderia cenocepacia]ONR50486.1 hypothetical protein A8E17_33405 [Burkholderia cenocepacia]
MKTKPTKITLDTVLSVMKPGRRYTAHDLARSAGVPLSTVRHLLASDRAMTRVDIKRGERRGQMFSLAGTCGGSGHVDTRVRPDFTSHLTGYAGWLSSHRALAMTTRGAQ